MVSAGRQLSDDTAAVIRAAPTAVVRHLGVAAVEQKQVTVPIAREHLDVYHRCRREGECIAVYSRPLAEIPEQLARRGKGVEKGVRHSRKGDGAIAQVAGIRRVAGTLRLYGDYPHKAHNCEK